MKPLHQGFFARIKKGLRAYIRSLLSQDPESGTTFVEVLVTMAIIAILMTTITISIIIFIPTANIAKAKTDIGSLRLAMTQYYLKYSKYPESGSTGLDELKVFIEDGKVPKDPWGNDYVYTVPGPEDNINYEIMSKGPNGNPGDEDDIVSWKLDQKPEEK